MIEHVRLEWRRRIEAEYASACITQELVLWLMQIAASPDLIDEGLRIVRDELDHADLSMRTYVAAGGTEPPVLDRARLCLPRTQGAPLEHDVLRACVDVFCIGETVAVPLFKHLRDGCEEPTAREVITRVLRDEVRHRDFGWLLLPWMLDLPMGEALRGILERELSQWFARVRRVYGASVGRAVGASERPLDAQARRWGLMEVSRYASVVEQTFEREWKPRFHGLGIDAARAWAEAERRA